MLLLLFSATSSLSHHLEDIYHADSSGAATSCLKLRWNISFKLSAHQLSWMSLQFIATLAAVIMAAVLGLSWGLYYAVKTIKALELASLFSTLDYSVTMDTWLQFPLQSANQRLKTGSRSIALSIRALLYICFIHPADNWFTDSIFLFLYLRGELFQLLLHFTVAHNRCQSCWWNDCISSLRRQQGLFLWRKLGLKCPSGVFSSCRKLCVKHRCC